MLAAGAGLANGPSVALLGETPAADFSMLGATMRDRPELVLVSTTPTPQSQTWLLVHAQ